MAAMPMTATTPYQKYLANALPEVWRSVSWRISPKKSIAWVSLEKSTPVSFRAGDDSSPILGIDIDVSILTRGGYISVVAAYTLMLYSPRGTTMQEEQ